MSDDLDFMPAAPPSGSKQSGTSESGDAKSKPAGGKPSPSPAAPGEDPPGSRAELPTWNRSRRKRAANVKAEQQDDVFQRGVRQASRRVIDAPKLVLGAIIITVGAIAVGVYLHNRQLASNAEAARMLAGATSAIVRGAVLSPEAKAEFGENIRFLRGPLYDSEEAREAAVDEALAAARSSGRSKVEQDATLVAAARAVRAGDFDAALTEYDAFLAAVGDDHPLRFLALEGKGNALEAKGEYEAALEAFAAIAPNPTDFYRHMALYHQGRMLELLERKDEALAIYEQFFQEFPPSREEMATPLVRKRVEALDPDFAARLMAPPAPVSIPAP